MVGLTTSSKVLQPEKEGDVRRLEVCENGKYITDRGIEALLVKVGGVCEGGACGVSAKVECVV